MTETASTRRRWERLLLVIAIAASLCLVIALAWGQLSRTDEGPLESGGQTPSSTASPKATPGPSPEGPGESSAVEGPPSGTYLGVFLNPSGVDRGGTLKFVLGNLPEFTAQMGRSPAIVSAYQTWDRAWVRNETMAMLSDTYGSIPMISWQCGNSDERVAAGDDDELITRFARQLKDYGRPVLLRWFWEHNLPIFPDCLGPAGERAAHYVAAFQRIAGIFHDEGADNVAFVWAPSSAELAAPMDRYYPGDDYVDWIGVDGYDGGDGNGFSEAFDPWYRMYAGRGKPMIIAETASTTGQATYLQRLGEQIPRDYPQVKAVIYFDAVGSMADWRLSSYGGAGLLAFAELGHDPHFAVMPEPP